MANKFFNFSIPKFNQNYGSDWSGFTTIINDNVDNLFLKIWQIYHLIDIDRMSATVLEYWISLKGIISNDDDTVPIKKAKLRQWLTKHRDKGLAVIYEERCSSVTGLTPTIYNGADFVWRWPDNAQTMGSRWQGSGDPELDYIRWPDDNPQFSILIDVKTLVAAELDEIVALLRERPVLPAFYKIYLIDSDFNILRTV